MPCCRKYVKIKSISEPEAIDTVSGPDPSICIVTVFFGLLPAWLPYYFRSCEANSSINYLLITDSKKLPSAPSNMRVVNSTTSEFEQLATQKIGFPVRIPYPYKTCDFKPTYGLLLEEFLQNFDFWGYSDLDVVFGNVRKYLTNSILKSHDIVTSRKEYLTGHFTLIRNESQLNNLFRSSKDFRSVFDNPETLGFDECGDRCQLLQGKWPLRFIDAKCDSITHVARRLVRRGEIRLYQSHLVCEGSELVNPEFQCSWRKGTLSKSDDGTEIMYLHFHFLKDGREFNDPPTGPIPQQFTISADGFSKQK